MNTKKEKAENILEIPIGFIGKITKTDELFFMVKAGEEYSFSSRLISPEILKIETIVFWTGKEFVLKDSHDDPLKN